MKAVQEAWIRARLAWNRMLLRWSWRHRQLGCARYLGTSVAGEHMWSCRLHKKDAL